MTEHGESSSTPWTPREAAKDLIRRELRRGSTWERLLQEHPSSWYQTDQYSATVGGTIFNGLDTPQARFLALEIDQVGVWRVQGQECWAVFPLSEIYEEVWREAHPGREPDALMEQGTLFSDSPPHPPDRK